MKKLALLASTALVAVVFAAPGAFAQQQNGPGGDSAAIAAQGQQQTATGVGVGTGGSVSDSGNSANLNENTAYSSNRNYNSNGGSAYQGQGQGQKQGQDQGQDQAQQNTNFQLFDFSATNSGNIDNPDIPVASAYAPHLWATEDTCMGSTSFGGQAVTFGFTFGSTWRDEDCVRRKDSRELYNMGNTMPALRVAALSRMCQKPDNMQALHAAGLSCPGEGVTTAADRTSIGVSFWSWRVGYLSEYETGPVAAVPAPEPTVEAPVPAPEALPAPAVEPRG